MTILVGASSWSDRSLVHGSRWYPRRSMRAAERMAYYASRFDVVEIDATFRFPPTPDLARQWADRTPDGFRMDVQAWSLLTGNATLPDSLWEDLRDEVRPELRDKPRLYASHVSEAAMVEAWERFRHALAPLAAAGRLGAVVLRLPPWTKPGDTGRALLREARERLAGLPLVAELRHPAWLAGDSCEETLAFLEDHDVAFLCVDDPALPPVAATTSELAVVRFHGRNPGDWDDPDAEMPIAQRYAYRYTTPELEEWIPRIVELAAAAPEVHVLFGNCWADDAVTNAEELLTLLRQADAGGPVTTEP